MSVRAYDKAKWHAYAENVPEDTTFEHGATHIAFFFRWCLEIKFLSKTLEKENAEELAQVRTGARSARDFVVAMLDGVLTSEELNGKGKAFANAYYHTENTKFAKLHGFYLTDYQNFADSLPDNAPGSNDYLTIEDSPQHYAAIKAILDARYKEFLEMKAAG